MILLNGRLARIVHPLQMQSLLPQDLALKWRRIVASSDRRTITTDAPPAAAGDADPSLDPDEWSGLRALGHQMLDDVFNELQGIRAGPVWRPMPDDVRGAWSDALPRVGVPLADVYDEYQRLIAPYTVGNRHPRFFGWVHGAGTAVGVLAEMLASGLNANCGGRDHAPIACERQVIRWAAEMLGLPRDSSGLVVTGTSVANSGRRHHRAKRGIGTGGTTGWDRRIEVGRLRVGGGPSLRRTGTGHNGPWRPGTAPYSM